jgi:hypothetical protein
LKPDVLKPDVLKPDVLWVYLLFYTRDGIFIFLRSSRIDSMESIPPAIGAWRDDTTTLFLFSSWPSFYSKISKLEFLKSLWGLRNEEEYRTGPPGYIGWWNSFLGINSGAP